MKNVTRLYTQFVPKNYQLSLILNPDESSFEGSVTITGRKTGKPSRRFTFHQNELTIKSATIVHHDKKSTKEITVERINLQKTYDEVRLHTEQTLFPGQYTITLAFSGKITDPMNGLYPSYFTHDGKAKKLLATQFESHHAREVFPCIDEPEAKATFDLTLTTPDEGLSVISNTLILSQEKSKGLLSTTFETTPIMSTYLLAFAYGDMGYKESQTERGTIVRTYATPDNVEFTDFALDTAVRTLEFYEDYFAIPYPLKKCDMLALPDFASGAMENWGLVTYREQTMLVDPNNTSLSTKQYVAMVIAHELAHQWFGNLVTMEWWTDLWLNEGFASWIEYLAVDALFPDWDMWTQFISSEQQAAFKLDALDNTHPIEVPINHPDEIRSIFDAISYNKGASVIHMLYGYLGPKDFQAGLRKYLNDNAYKNTQTKDLWAALEKASGKPVSSFMSAWTSLAGFPLVSISNQDNKTKISQERFYALKPSEPSDQTWPIPVLGPKDSPERLDNHQTTYATNADSSLINRGRSGFYRTQYSAELLNSIAEDIDELEPLDRLGLLSDSFEVAKAGYGSTVDTLKLLAEYQNENNAAVWDIIAMNIGEIRRVMDDDKLRESIKPLITRLTASQLKRLGFKERSTDSHFDKLLRPTILGLAASADEPTVLKWCLESFDKASTPADVHADLRSTVFTTAARHGNEKTFTKLLEFHSSTDSSEERLTLAAALTSFEQPKLISKALDLITTDNVRRQDSMYWVVYSFGNRHAKRATWQWLKDHWTWIEKELGSDLSFYRTPIYAARCFSDNSFKKEYSEFFADRTSPALDRSIKQGAEMLGWQTAWKQRDLKAIQAYLSQP